VLKHFEKVLKKCQPERDWNFLDRNFTETLDALTLRQELSNAITRRAELITEYYSKEDALLVAIHYKTPPGLLLRRQWTHPF